MYDMAIAAGLMEHRLMLPKLPKRRDNKLHSDIDQDSVHTQPSMAEYHQMDYSGPEYRLSIVLVA